MASTKERHNQSIFEGRNNQEGIVKTIIIVQLANDSYWERPISYLYPLEVTAEKENEGKQQETTLEGDKI